MTTINFGPWSEKYRPRTLKEVVSHEKEISELLNWIKNFKKEKQKAVLLHGPVGNGKTSLAYALASDLNYEIIEMNASDFRTEESINEKIGHAVKQQSLLGKKGKIILIEEVDGIYGTADRGGLPAIYNVIKDTQYPVILTANNPWKQNLRTLRGKCKAIALKKIDIRSAAKKLKEICAFEKISTPEEVIHKIAHLSQGDLRAAINDLQTIAEGKTKVESEDLKVLESREKKITVFETLLAIFKSKDTSLVKKAFDNSDKEPDEIILWLAENIPSEYEKPEEIALAYDILSRADVFRGRIMRTQSWGLQSYSNELMSFGVASAKKEKYHKFTKYNPPQILIKMGSSKISRAERDASAEELGKFLHCSKKEVLKHMPYLETIIRLQK